MPVVTRTFESRSSAGTVYTAHFNTDTGEASCDCPGWINKRANKPRECKHTKELTHGVPVAPKEAPPSTEGVPDFIEPMLAHPKERELPIAHYAGNGWDLEEKYNGQRLIVCKGVGAAMMTWSRPRAGDPPKPKRVPDHVKNALCQLPPGVFDGEIFVPGAKFWDSTRLDRAHEKMVVLWDVMNVFGNDATRLPLTERRKLLRMALEHIGPDREWVVAARPLAVSHEEVEAIWARGGEGAMLKRRDALYHPGKRSWDWLKVKKYIPAIMTIMGFEEGLTGPHAVMLLMDEDGGDTKVKSQSSHMPPDFKATPEKYVGRRLRIEHQGRTPPSREHPRGGYLHPMFDHLVEDS